MQVYVHHCLTVSLGMLLLVASPQSCAGSNCGIYAVHAALHALGFKPVLDEMIVPEYFSSSVGESTALDLIHLSEKYGAKASFRTGMTYGDLRIATSPVILHTSTPVGESTYYHWVVFLGMEGTSLKLYDPPKGLYSVSSAELLSFWDGNAVVVEPASSPHPLSSIIGFIDLEVALAFLLILIFGIVVIHISYALTHPKLGIVLTTILAALAWHACVDFGFFGNRYARTTIATRFASDSFPIVTTEQLLGLMGNKDVAIVDARPPDAFKSSHIPGAMNIPVDVTHGSLREALSQIPTSNHVIVYCQSEKCGWADMVAHVFPLHGYRQVSIYRAGLDGFEPAKLASFDK